LVFKPKLVGSDAKDGSDGRDDGSIDSNECVVDADPNGPFGAEGLVALDIRPDCGRQ
jgi:hypothetical protein